MTTAAIVTLFPTFVSGEAFAQFALLDLNSSGVLVKTPANGRGQYIANRQSFAAGETISVTPTNHPGVLRLIASGACAIGDEIRVDGAGKVANDGAGRVLGTCVKSCSADGDAVHVDSGGSSGESLGAIVDADGGTLTAADSGKTYLNTGATGAATFVLPAATPGLNFRFFVNAAQELRLDPNTTQTIALPSTGVQSAAGKYIVADAVGEFVEIRCLIAGQWEVLAYRGTWTAES